MWAITKITYELDQGEETQKWHCIWTHYICDCYPQISCHVVMCLVYHQKGFHNNDVFHVIMLIKYYISSKISVYINTFNIHLDQLLVKSGCLCTGGKLT